MMRPIRKHLSFWLTLLLVGTLLLAGCAPRPGAGQGAVDEDEFFVDLPAILVEFDENGEAIILGKPAAELKDALGVDLSALSLGNETLDKFTANNIQHIQINNTPNVLRIYQNGNPLPAIIWDADAMNALAATLTSLGTDASAIESLVPVLPNLGVGLALQMPVASGKQPIPLQTKGRSITSEQALQLFSSAKAAASSINLTLDYGADGTPEIGGINPFMLSMIGLQPAALALPPDQLESIAGLGIQSLSIKTVQGGMLVTINGNTLPFLQWANAEELSSMLSLAGAFAGPEMAGTLGQLQLIFNFPGISATVTFPES
ncbi:MAG TPA: hypothetical protein P5121_04415 [Caldilineaceae bacterium]|nr:hypothetical protein [Caldilineaceae bacterium]